MLNKGAFAFKIIRGALKWSLKGGSRLIEVAASAGLTVYVHPTFSNVCNTENCVILFLTNYAEWNFPRLSNGPGHFSFKGCWVVFFIFIQRGSYMV